MKSLYIDQTTNDLVVENNQLKFTSTTGEWLSQKIEARLKMIYGEWFVNREQGVPYFSEILKKQVDFNNVQIILSNIIKETEGVSQLVDFNIDYNREQRIYTYSFTVSAEDGELVSSEGSL